MAYSLTHTHTHTLRFRGDHLLTIPAEEWVPVALVFEEETSLLGRKVSLYTTQCNEDKYYAMLGNGVFDKQPC